MKRLFVLVFAVILFTGCGQRKEELKVNNTGEPKKETVNTQKESAKEESSDIESENREESNTSSGRKNTSQTILNLKTSEASSNIGSSAIVKGYVADVVVREKVAYLNFDGKYPKNTFTAVIFPDKFDVFGDLMSYKNKTVEVKGKIGQYGGKPQIILNNKSQLKVVN